MTQLVFTAGTETAATPPEEYTHFSSTGTTNKPANGKSSQSRALTTRPSHHGRRRTRKASMTGALAGGLSFGLSGAIAGAAVGHTVGRAVVVQHQRTKKGTCGGAELHGDKQRTCVII